MSTLPRKLNFDHLCVVAIYVLCYLVVPYIDSSPFVLWGTIDFVLVGNTVVAYQIGLFEFALEKPEGLAARRVRFETMDTEETAVHAHNLVFTCMMHIIVLALPVMCFFTQRWELGTLLLGLLTSNLLFIFYNYWPLIRRFLF